MREGRRLKKKIREGSRLKKKLRTEGGEIGRNFGIAIGKMRGKKK